MSLPPVLPGAVTKTQPRQQAIQLSTEEAARRQRSLLRTGLLRQKYASVSASLKSYLDGDAGRDKVTVSSIAEWCLRNQELPLLVQLCRDSPYPAHFEFNAETKVKVNGEERLLTAYLRDEGAPHGLMTRFRDVFDTVAPLEPHACVVSMELVVSTYDEKKMDQLVGLLPRYTGLRSFSNYASVRPEVATAMIEGLAGLPELEAVDLRSLPAGCGQKALRNLFESSGIREVGLEGSPRCTDDIITALCAAKPSAVAREIHLPELNGSQMKRLLTDVKQPLASVRFLGPDHPGKDRPDLAGISQRWKKVNVSHRHRTGQEMEAFAQQIHATYREEAMDRLIFSSDVQRKIMEGFSEGWRPGKYPDAGLAADPFKEGLGRYLDAKDLANLSIVNRETARSVDEKRSEGVQKEHDEYVKAGGPALESQFRLHELHHVWMLEDGDNAWMREPILDPWDKVTAENFDLVCKSVGSSRSTHAALDLTKLEKDQVVKLLGLLRQKQVVLALDAPLDLRTLEALHWHAPRLVQLRIGGVAFERGKKTQVTVPLAQLLGKDVPEQKFRALLEEMKAEFVLQEPRIVRIGNLKVDEMLARLEALDTPAPEPLHLTLDGHVDPGVIRRLAAFQKGRLSRLGLGGQVFERGEALNPGAVTVVKALLGQNLAKAVWDLAETMNIPYAGGMEEAFQAQADDFINTQRIDELVAYLKAIPYPVRVSADAMVFDEKKYEMKRLVDDLGKKDVMDKVTVVEAGIAHPEAGRTATSSNAGALGGGGASGPSAVTLKVDSSNIQSTITNIQHSRATRVSLRIGNLTPVELQKLREGLEKTASIQALELTLDHRVTPGKLAALAQTGRLERLTFADGQVFARGADLDGPAVALARNLFMKEGMATPLQHLLKALAVPLTPAQADWFAEKYIELGDEDGLVDFIQSLPPGTIRINPEAMMLNGESVDPIGEVLERRKVAGRVMLGGASAVDAAPQLPPVEPASTAAAGKAFITKGTFDDVLPQLANVTQVSINRDGLTREQWAQITDALTLNKTIASLEIDGLKLIRRKGLGGERGKRLAEMFKGKRNLKSSILAAMEIPEVRRTGGGTRIASPLLKADDTKK